MFLVSGDPETAEITREVCDGDGHSQNLNRKAWLRLTYPAVSDKKEKKKKTHCINPTGYIKDKR